MSNLEYNFTIQRVEDGKTVKRPATWYKKRHKCLAMAHAALIEEERKARYIASLKAGSANIADKRADKARKAEKLEKPRFTIILKNRRAKASEPASEQAA